MKKRVGVPIIPVFIILFLYGCAMVNAEDLHSKVPANMTGEKTANKHFAGGDGSSLEKAVIIKYTGDYSESIGQEYEYIEMRFGIKGKDWLPLEQKMIDENNKCYDKIIIQILPHIEEKTLYFDITEPFNIMLKQFEQSE